MSGEPTTTSRGPAWRSPNAWNRSLSWELIFGITPHLPRPVLFMAHHVTTLLCFATMVRQRRAARRNLERITGLRGFRNLRLTYRTFLQFSRFMVAYAEMRGGRSPLLQPPAGHEEAERTIRALLAEGRGLIVLTAHLGQWDVGLRQLAITGVPVHVVMHETEALEVARHAGEVRQASNVTVHQSRDSELLGLELALALRRGEVVAIQADRPLGEHDRETMIFGAPLALPTGPVRLARATGAPILPAFTIFEGPRRCRIELGEPIRVGARRGAMTEEELEGSMRLVGDALERAMGRHPDQWFCFYDAWARSPLPRDVRPMA